MYISFYEFLVDLGGLAGNYGYGVPAPLNLQNDASKVGLEGVVGSEVPEPATLGILGIGALMGLGRKRRK